MKTMILLLCLLPTFVQALDAPQLERLLAKVAPAQSNVYVEARDEIVALGSNAIPLLAQASENQALTWQQRLVARICHERISRASVLRELLSTDWQSYPPYQNPGDAKYGSILGSHIYMGEYVVPKCKEAGLWYYYLELTWKKTGETSQLRPRRDTKFEKAWPDWCLKALKGQPEDQYTTAILCDRLRANPDMADRRDRDFYGELLEKKPAAAVPLLVDRYETFMTKRGGHEVFPGALDVSFRNVFAPILDFADASHADLIEKFIDEHPQLTELKPKLAEVRARPAAAPTPEPPFRSGAP